MRKTPSHAATLSSSALAVRLSETLYALPIAAIEEVLPALPIEPIPQSPAFVLGVVFVRGHVIPVMSAAERLGLKDHLRPDEPNIVCFRIANRLIGVEFDEAIDLIQIGGDESLAANEIGSADGFFSGVIEHNGQIIRLLDPDQLLSHTEAKSLDVVQGTR